MTLLTLFGLGTLLAIDGSVLSMGRASLSLPTFRCHGDRKHQAKMKLSTSKCSFILGISFSSFLLVFIWIAPSLTQTPMWQRDRNDHFSGTWDIQTWREQPAGEGSNSSLKCEEHHSCYLIMLIMGAMWSNGFMNETWAGCGLVNSQCGFMLLWL